VIELKVKDAYEKLSPRTDKVQMDDSLEKVFEVLLRNKSTRTVFVVDEKDCLRGAITLNEIFNLLEDSVSPRKLLFFLKQQKKDCAADIMVEPTIVQLEDTLEDALIVARNCGLQDIPVCKNGKLVGELDCFELIYGLIKSHQGKSK